MVSESYFITSFTKIIWIFHIKDIFAQKQHFLQIQNFFPTRHFCPKQYFNKTSIFRPKFTFYSRLISFLPKNLIFIRISILIFIRNRNFPGFRIFHKKNIFSEPTFFVQNHFFNGASIFCPKFCQDSQFQKLKILPKFNFSKKSCTEQFYHFLPIICISRHKNKYHF